MYIVYGLERHGCVQHGGKECYLGTDLMGAFEASASICTGAVNYGQDTESILFIKAESILVLMSMAHIHLSNSTSCCGFSLG